MTEARQETYETQKINSKVMRLSEGLNQEAVFKLAMKKLERESERGQSFGGSRGSGSGGGSYKPSLAELIQTSGNGVSQPRRREVVPEKKARAQSSGAYHVLT